MSKEEMKVMIVGGGNCGLAIATGLQKAGIQTTIFERDNEERFRHGNRDWGMLLHWGAEYLAKLLPEHLVPRMTEFRCNPFLDEAAIAGQKVPFVNALTGKTLAEIPMGGVNRISRMKLRRFLTDGQSLSIKFEKILQDVKVNDSGVDISFADGTSERGTVLIGCDGSKSQVRNFLVGKEVARLQPVDLTMINFPLDGYTGDEAALLQTMHPVFKIATHPTRPGNAILAALDISDLDEPTKWKFQNYLGWWGPPYASDLKTSERRCAFYRELMSGFCEPFRTAAMKLGESEKIPIYAGQQWAPTMDWDNHGGRVTLAGDAAHPMLPQRGQGLNNAMKDASEIVEALVAAANGRSSLEAAVMAYEKEMKPRGAEEVALSYEQAIKAREQSTIRDSPIFKVGWARNSAGESAKA